MNSVFNLASYNFNQLTDDELLTWLHSEGPSQYASDHSDIG